MSFRFYRRINIGKGLGFNISKSGVSPSLRTSIGSVNKKGFSILSGINGLSYKGSFKNSSSPILIALVIGIIIFIPFILISAIRFFFNFIKYLFLKIVRFLIIFAEK